MSEHLDKHLNRVHYEDSPIDGYEDETGFPWFAASDIYRLLGVHLVPTRQYITLFDVLALCVDIERPKPALEFVKNIARMRPQFFHDSIWPLLSAIELERAWAKMMLVSEKKQRPVTCTYLMRDNRNGLIKIGKSITPGKREKTLQSEVPDIVMFAMLEQNIEATLHKRYKEQRVRGEWFSLTDIQLEELFLEYPFSQLRPAKRK